LANKKIVPREREMHSLKVTVTLLLLSGIQLTWADPITRTFVHGQNGYNGYKSVTIGSYYDTVDSTDDIGKKMMLDWWINNAIHETNSEAACIADMIC